MGIVLLLFVLKGGMMLYMLILVEGVASLLFLIGLIASKSFTTAAMFTLMAGIVLIAVYFVFCLSYALYLG